MDDSMEKIVAMAVAAVAEDMRTDVTRIRVVSWKEIQKSPLAQYISDHGIDYKKYQLGD